MDILSKIRYMNSEVIQRPEAKLQNLVHTKLKAIRFYQANYMIVQPKNNCCIGINLKT